VPRRALAPFATARLRLRPFAAADAEAAFVVFGDSEVMRYSLSGADRDVASTAQRLARYAAASAADGFGRWAVIDWSEGMLIGSCGLVPVPGGEIELAYRIRRDRWGHGFASEAARAFLACGFAELGLDRIVAFIEPANTASHRVARRIGMRYLEDRLYDGGIPVTTYVIDRPGG
jgi:RimJ/RimL family protein N-acetyltransferase